MNDDPIILDSEQRAFDPEQPMMLSAFNEKTKASGFYRLEPVNEDTALATVWAVRPGSGGFRAR